MFVGKVSSLTWSGSDAPLGLALALLANIEMGWKGFPGTKSQAIYKHS